MKIYSLILSFYLFSIPAWSQNPYKNGIYMEIGGAYGYYGLGFEHIWLNSEKVSIESSIGYQLSELNPIRQKLNIETGLEFLKYKEFNLVFGVGIMNSYRFSSKYSNPWFNLFPHIYFGPEFSFLKKRFTLSFLYYSGYLYGWNVGKSGSQSEQLTPYLLGIKLKYQFGKVNQE